jgi:hypothetical protein
MRDVQNTLYHNIKDMISLYTTNSLSNPVTQLHYLLLYASTSENFGIRV